DSRAAGSPVLVACPDQVPRGLEGSRPEVSEVPEAAGNRPVVGVAGVESPVAAAARPEGSAARPRGAEVPTMVRARCRRTRVRFRQTRGCHPSDSLPGGAARRVPIRCRPMAALTVDPRSRLPPLVAYPFVLISDSLVRCGCFAQNWAAG